MVVIKESKEGDSIEVKDHRKKSEEVKPHIPNLKLVFNNCLLNENMQRGPHDEEKEREEEDRIKVLKEVQAFPK